MGTRHLIQVVANGKTLVSQYGQWDGYPESCGVGILEFLRPISLDFFQNEMEKFKQACLECRQIDKAGIAKVEADKNWSESYPHLSRDCSFKVLELIYRKGVRELSLDLEFMKDSLFCEWAYVIDFDKNTFEVYKGFNTRKLAKSARFYGDGKPGYTTGNGRNYYPVRLLLKYTLFDLPTSEQFITDCVKKSNPK